MSDDDLIRRRDAKAAMCYMCAKPDRYKPAQPIEGSTRLFHFQGSDNWNAGQCQAQPIDSVVIAAPLVPVDARAAAEEVVRLIQDEYEHGAASIEPKIVAIISRHFPSPASAVDARELVAEWTQGTDSAVISKEDLSDLAQRITTYATAHGEERWREGVEAAAKVADDCNLHKDDCKQCLQALTISMLIRALQREEQGGEGRST